MEYQVAQAQELDHCYADNRVYKISLSKPPKPFGDDQFYEHEDSHRMWQHEKIGDATHLDFVFNEQRYKELPEGDPVPQPRTMLIRLGEAINTGEDKTSQILLATIVDWSPKTHPEFPTDKVAVKFFDPLFAIFYSDRFPRKTDVIYDVTHAHARETEALAYLTWLKSLAPGPGDTFTEIEDFFPHFYGSWTTNFTSAQAGFEGKTRPVKLLLTEYIDGLNMEQLCEESEDGAYVPLAENGDELPGPDHDDGKFYHDRRMAVIKKVLDGTMRLRHNGVLSMFFMRPWCFMIEGGWKLYDRDGPETGPRVVLVNFTKHVTGPSTLAGCVSMQTYPKLHDPIDFYDMSDLDVFNGWVPKSWMPNPDECKAWLKQAFEGGDYMDPKDSDVLCDAFDKAQDEIRRGKRDPVKQPIPLDAHNRIADGYRGPTPFS